jgi:branched-chain amino acid transport system substrate-binding protein
MKNKIYVAIIMLTLVSLLVVSLVTSCKPSVEEPIVIGMPIELSGYMVVVGIPAMQGATLAVEMAGYEVAGRPIKFIVEDTATDVGQTMDKVRKLVETDKACLLIGPVNSGCADAMAGYLDKVKVPDLALEGHSTDMALKHNWIWLVGGTLHQATYPLGIYTYDELGYRKVTTLGIDFVAGHEFIEGFVNPFTERGGNIIQQQWYAPDAMDLTPYILALKQADALVGSFLGTSSFVFHRQAKELGVKMPIVETPGEMFSPSVQNEMKDIPLGLRGVIGYTWNLDTSGNKEFVEAYQKRWGELPDPTAADGYNDVQIALAALRKTGGDTSPDALAKALNAISMEGIQGHVSFTPEHVASRAFHIVEYVKLNSGYGSKLLKTYIVDAKRVGDKITYSLVK